MNKIIAYCRVGCPHSDETKELLNNLCSAKLSNIEIIDVKNDDISKKNATSEIKELFNGSNETQKNGIDTYNVYPRIIYISKSNTPYFVGGNDKLKTILKKVNSLVSTKYKKDMSDADIIKLCVDENKLGLINNNDIRLAYFLIKKLEICK
jgi:glutaredoxin